MKKALGEGFSFKAKVWLRSWTLPTFLRQKRCGPKGLGFFSV